MTTEEEGTIRRVLATIREMATEVEKQPTTAQKRQRLFALGYCEGLLDGYLKPPLGEGFGRLAPG